MNNNEFISELSRSLKDDGIRLNQEDLKTIITCFIQLIHERVLEGEEVKIKNFGTFYLDDTSNRVLPGGKQFDIRKVVRFRVSRNFKNKSE